jgi:hypothetical protein
VVVAGAAGAGTVLTVLTRHDPGLVLGVFVVIGTVAACLAVRTGRAYLMVPAPALAYLAGAFVAGLIHDRAADASRTALAINAARWTASGFLAMVAATALAVLIAAARWLLLRRGAAYRRPPAPTRGSRPRSRLLG